jgi:translation initiation factor 2 gamma subunit (eIF-2gamma)
MTKFVAVAVNLALMLAVSVPAFAQATAVGGSVQYVDCDQVQVAVTQQVNAADNQRLAVLRRTSA